jgi:hypothetical protein
MSFRIPLKNKKKEIIDYTYVSKEDFKLLNKKYNWHKDGNYVCGIINTKKWSLHRFIMIEILKNNINSKIKVDHIDNNPLNNKRDNLRIVSDSENARNKIKSKNKSSKYIGVSYIKKENSWLSCITINNKKINANYTNEFHAAHQYNLWCIEFNLTTANLNIIPDKYLNNFILYKKKDKKDKLPTNITLYKNSRYRVQIKKIHYGVYNTLLEALITRNFKLKEIENKKKDKILNIPIKRNKDNQAIIEIFNKSKEKICETIVDDNIYYDLMFFSWCKSGNYFINSNNIKLHRYIMNYNENNFIDHINNNPLDNRKDNLRIVTPTQNNMNKSKHKNSSSKYIGVSFHKKNNIFESKICINGKVTYLGSFKNEDDAAKNRDEATKKYFGVYGNLNFI